MSDIMTQSNIGNIGGAGRGGHKVEQAAKATCGLSMSTLVFPEVKGACTVAEKGAVIVGEIAQQVVGNVGSVATPAASSIKNVIGNAAGGVVKGLLKLLTGGLVR